MMVLISYDVSTMDSAGKSRLRKVAKECQNHASAFKILSLRLIWITLRFLS